MQWEYCVCVCERERERETVVGPTYCKKSQIHMFLKIEF